ncbi:MAG: acetyl-CoA carboxylase biotin carboxyl carrier protein [Proteobacteria bacterium]|nr:acetyl-CoA carboxylase biotin carboxyl carrier protein [Pseudomonadota bacterium]
MSIEERENKAAQAKKVEKVDSLKSSSNFSIKDLSSILEMLEKHEVTEFCLVKGQEKLSLKRGKNTQVTQIQNFPQQIPMYSNNSAPQSNYTENNTNSAPQTVELKQAVADTSTPQIVKKSSYKEITSPMVGTFYRRPAVDAEAYVKIGDTVKKGDVLCIVEAMKLMNEIESDTPGKIVEICLEDGQMVEYGEVLFRIEPL